jgi:hypothetical protein
MTLGLKNSMTVEQAMQLVKNTATAVERWGKQANPPYSVNQMMAAIAVLAGKVDLEGPTKEELTKVKRQLAACEARVAKLSKPRKASKGNPVPDFVED